MYKKKVKKKRKIRQAKPEPCPHCLVEEEDPLHQYLLHCLAIHVLRQRVALTQETESIQAACFAAAGTLRALLEVCTLAAATLAQYK